MGQIGTGIVYAIVQGDDRFVKFGFTRGEPADRLRQLQTGNPNQLRFHGLWEGTPEIERKLHKRWEEYRAMGEWFDCSDGPLAEWVRTGKIPEADRQEGWLDD